MPIDCCDPRHSETDHPSASEPPEFFRAAASSPDRTALLEKIATFNLFEGFTAAEDVEIETDYELLCGGADDDLLDGDIGGEAFIGCSGEA